MCSSTRGPAMAPSLVTWPTRITVIAALLGEARQLRRAFAHLGHAARRRFQRLGVDGLDRVDDHHLGRCACASRATIASSWTSASSSTGALTRPSRCARSATCSADSSPVTYSARCAAADRRHRLQQQRRLADARIAAEQHHAAGHEPAAQHAVELLDAGRRARIDLRARPRRAAAPRRRHRRRPESASAAERQSVSTSVFHAPQCGHWPCHLLLRPPHSVQAYAVRRLGHAPRAFRQARPDARRPYRTCRRPRRRPVGDAHRGGEIGARAQQRAERGDDRVAGAGHVVDLARLRRNAYRARIGVQRHAFLGARDQQRLERELGAQLLRLGWQAPPRCASVPRPRGTRCDWA